MLDPCPSPEIITEYLLGRIDPAYGAQIDSHLDHCPTCQTALTVCKAEEDTFISALRIGHSEFGFEYKVEVNESLRSAPSLKSVRKESVVQTPSQLGPYQLLKLLGKGGMGEVYLARHTRLEMIVAVKVLADRLVHDAQAVARFDREMKAVGRLSHPNIVRATDAGDYQGKHFLAMEFIEGNDLSQVCRAHGPLTIANACEMIRQAALAIQHAHDHGLIHRDLKPSNLMLTPEGLVKVLDLGLARLNESTSEGLTNDFQIMGTADYMAPEQAAQATAVDWRADIYSLGCTLYTLLAGRAPFADEQHSSSILKIIAHQREVAPTVKSLRPEIPAALSAIVAKAMEKASADRFASAAELATALQAFTDGADLFSLPTDIATVNASQGKTSDVSEYASLVDTINSPAMRPPSQPQRTSTPSRKWIAVGALIALSGIGVAAALSMVFRSGNGTIVVEIDGDEIGTRIDGQHLIIEDLAKATTYRLSIASNQAEQPLAPGDYRIKVENDASGLELETDKFQINRNQKTIVRAYVQPTSPPTSPSLSPTPPRPPASNDQLALAQWAISKHGWPVIATDSQVVFFDNLTRIPDEPFIVQGINFTKPFVPSDSEFEMLRQSSTLTHLEFSDLQLTDHVMEKLIALPQLSLFRLRYDEAPPQGLERLAELPHLFDLTVGGEYVGDDELPMLKGVKNAVRVTIGGKQVTDAGLVHLADMTHLEFVSLIFTRVEGSGLVHLTKLPKLWSLQTPYSPLNDSAAESLSQMKAVTWLNLAFTQVGDEALKRIVAMPKLEDLDLTQTQITNAGIAFLQPSTSLRRLHVAAPGIDDGALEALSKLTQLTFLSVGGRMSAEAAETLRTRLPNCQIHSD